MKYLKRTFISALLATLLLFSAALSACTKPAEITFADDFEYTSASLSATDSFGRFTPAYGNRSKDRDVGLFYFLWLGAHTSNNRVYDVSSLEENNPDALWSLNDPESPVGSYHFWGEPLYGYYDSSDPWVLTRHVELFTSAGIDFLVFDTTNAVTYDVVVSKLLQILDKYQKQGFAVPKVVFMTNSSTYSVVNRLYDRYYTEGSDNYYPGLWYAPEGKPLICGNTMFYDPVKPEDKKILDFFDLRNTEWPDSKWPDENAFPWMSWRYAQTNHNGIMSVSVAQHVAGRMSNKEGNWGRGFNQNTFINESAGVDSGQNFSQQWDTVFSSLSTDTPVHTVMVTGWNEWIAIKFSDNSVPYFVDLFNKEYSRDLEMMKGGYADNFYLQLFNNVKKYKYQAISAAPVNKKTIAAYADWENIPAFRDFEGDAMERSYKGYVNSINYTDNSARNDIIAVKIAHDNDYVYFNVQTADAITEYTDGDSLFMNIWINTSKGSGYDYVLNREYGKLTSLSGGDAADAEVVVNGNVMTAKIKLSDLGLNHSGAALAFKVTDNVDGADFNNFYIQGDSAPLGRLNYTYGNYNRVAG